MAVYVVTESQGNSHDEPLINIENPCGLSLLGRLNSNPEGGVEISLQTRGAYDIIVAMVTYDCDSSTEHFADCWSD